MKAKNLINRYFNLKQHIITIRGTNMNPSTPQCKNCWKWEHTIFAYHIHSSKFQKYNSLYKLKHYRKIMQYYKANFKTNPSILEIKKEESCTHSFKCVNCKGEHQIDNNSYLFWKHEFNRDQYTKKSQELQKIRANSIYLSMNRVR